MLTVTSTKRFIERSLRKCGYELHKLPSATTADCLTPYSEVKPLATYSPWSADRDFQRVFAMIRSHTLVDVYRSYELWQLIAEAAKLPSGEAIEVGVWRGGTGGLIAARCETLGLSAHVYLCDTFTGVVKASGTDTVYSGGEHSDTSTKVVSDLLGRLGVHNTALLQGIFPEQTGAAVADKVFRFCHIDVDVYQSAKDAVEWLWRRLVKGGIMVYDDYGFPGCEGIARFVDEQRKYDDRAIIHNLNGHAIALKLA